MSAGDRLKYAGRELTNPRSLIGRSYSHKLWNSLAISGHFCYKNSRSRDSKLTRATPGCWPLKARDEPAPEHL